MRKNPDDINHEETPSSSKRRDFLRRSASIAGAASAAMLFPASIRRALAIPAGGQTGTIQDIKHVVILMQENRSVDHYFGTLQGVRGFGDRFPINLASGQLVWQQSNGTAALPPYHFDSTTSNAMAFTDTPHDYGSGQAAWNQGMFGSWPKWKTEYSMGYYKRADIPFHFALADAFTLCDAHHCGLTGPTDPDRIMFWSGSCFNPELGGLGINCTSTDAEVQTLRLSTSGTFTNGNFPAYTYSGTAFNWPTLPEILQNAGVSWNIYQDPNNNWNSLLHGCLAFANFRNAQPGSALYENGINGTPNYLAQFTSDVANNALPQVSWILPTPELSEHPSYSSADGAWFISQVLDALTANPTVWSQTALFITYDENDGLFDHMPAPAVPSYDINGNVMGGSTLPLAGEYYSASAGDLEAADTVSGSVRPFGLGARVPMFVISPWSTGGFINSQVFTHTSMGMFLEKRFGVTVPNISPWHRAVVGDLTSAFNFATPSTAALPTFPDTSGYAAFDLAQAALPAVAPPSTPEALFQEPGFRPSRALPYELHTSARVTNSGPIELLFSNTGAMGAVFHVYDQNNLNVIPRRYTVEAGKMLNDNPWNSAASNGAYNLWVYSTNGFFRSFNGNSATDPQIEVQVCYDPVNGGVYATVANHGTQDVPVTFTANVYTTVYDNGPWVLTVPAGGTAEQNWSLAGSANWYDFTLSSGTAFSRRFAGRVETGKDSTTDPAMATLL
jgi:phospholipase C